MVKRNIWLNKCSDVFWKGLRTKSIIIIFHQESALFPKAALKGIVCQENYFAWNLIGLEWCGVKVIWMRGAPNNHKTDLGSQKNLPGTSKASPWGTRWHLTPQVGFMGIMGPSHPNDHSIHTQNMRFEAKLTFWRSCVRFIGLAAFVAKAAFGCCVGHCCNASCF